MNSEWEILCFDRMKEIIAVYKERFDTTTVSGDQIQSAYQKISGGQIRIPGFGNRKIKSLLCHIDNLKPHLRAKAEPLLFEMWYQELKTVKKESVTKEITSVEEEAKQEPEPVETMDKQPTSPVFFKKRKEDLFDKLLNIAAALTALFVQWK